MVPLLVFRSRYALKNALRLSSRSSCRAVLEGRGSVEPLCAVEAAVEVRCQGLAESVSKLDPVRGNTSHLC